VCLISLLTGRRLGRFWPLRSRLFGVGATGRLNRDAAAKFQLSKAVRQRFAHAALLIFRRSPTLNSRETNSLFIRQFQFIALKGGFMVAVQSRIFRSGLLLGIALSVSLLSSAAQAYTPEQQQACTGDAFRLCGDAIPDVDRVTVCMIRNKAQLSPGCRVYFREPEPEAIPVARVRKPVRLTPVAARKPVGRKPVSVKPKKTKKPARPASAS
jgi:hypothetical protein